MSDFVNSIIGGAFPQSAPAFPQTRNAASEKAFSEALSEAERNPVDKFLKYQAMTPAEKLRASYLSQKGLSEEDVAAMTPDEQKKLEQEILAKIREKMGVGSGGIAAQEAG